VERGKGGHADALVVPARFLRYRPYASSARLPSELATCAPTDMNNLELLKIESHIEQLQRGTWIQMRDMNLIDLLQNALLEFNIEGVNLF
jgi:hypothetical protein